MFQFRNLLPHELPAPIWPKRVTSHVHQPATTTARHWKPERTAKAACRTCQCCAGGRHERSTGLRGGLFPLRCHLQRRRIETATEGECCALDRSGLLKVD